MLLFTDIKISVITVLMQKSMYIQPITRVDSYLSSYDMIQRPEELKCMRLTIRSEELLLKSRRISSDRKIYKKKKKEKRTSDYLKKITKNM